jgi:hypothetical protein
MPSADHATLRHTTHARASRLLETTAEVQVQSNKPEACHNISRWLSPAWRATPPVNHLSKTDPGGRRTISQRSLLVPKFTALRRSLGTQLSAQLRCFSPEPKASRNPVQWLSQLLPFIVLITLPSLVHADDLTGMPYDDPKDLSPVSTQTASSSSSGLFLPMPGWAHGGVMPPLPAELRPMGGKTPVAAPPKVAAAPLAPPKDTPPLAPAKEETVAAPRAPAPPAETPAMVTVSPFLQWIKSNPQAAAAQARQEANGYNTPPNSNAPTGPTHNTAVINGQGNSSGDPYWLPPLIDSPDITPAVGGSAAIYSTPQR